MAINKVVNRGTKSHAALKNCIKYVLREQKAKEGLVYMTGPSPEKINWKAVYQSFIDEKNLWNKNSGRMYAHNIISFHSNESITPLQALEFGKEFVERWFSNNQTLISVHQDKEHTHIHMVTNTVSFVDGKKLHTNKADLQKMKNITNEMCREKGLSVAEKGKHFSGKVFDEGETIAWEKDKYRLVTNDKKKSYVADCAIAVIEAKEKSCTKDEFIREMSERGWRTTWTDNKKHITFTDSNGNKVRDSNISGTFSMNINKEALLNEFERKNANRPSKRKPDRYKTRDCERNDAELERYYAEVEAAVGGNRVIGKTIKSAETVDRTEGQAFDRRQAGRQGRDTESFIGKIRTDISDIRVERRAVINAANQSIANERQSIADTKQRRFENKQRPDVDERTRAIESRTGKNSGRSR